MAKFSSTAAPAIIELDDTGHEVKEEIPQYLPPRQIVAAPVRKTVAKHSHDRPVNIAIASTFGLVVIAFLWQFGASTTVSFLHSGLKLHWTAEIGLRKLSGGVLGDYTIDLLWLLPVGLTYFQVVYRPPLSVKGIVTHFRTDPIFTVFFMGLTSIGIFTSFFGLLDWLKTVAPRAEMTNPIMLMAAFISATAIEYLCEPLAIKFVSELKRALEAL